MWKTNSLPSLYCFPPSFSLYFIRLPPHPLVACLGIRVNNSKVNSSLKKEGIRLHERERVSHAFPLASSAILSVPTYIWL